MSGLVILGAGATGLGAGLVTGAPVFERSASPGGICTSYYVGMDGNRSETRREDEEDFRFEIGGGHWIFGGNQRVRGIFEEFTSLKSYNRRSSVYLPRHDAFVPYPLQEHLDSLPESVSQHAREELTRRSESSPETMAEWMRKTFGETLYDTFFGPFNEMYTSGLAKSVAPQDRYKTPAAKANTAKTGYNAEFIYPEAGLDTLFRTVAAQCDVRYGMNVTRIDTAEKRVHFESGESVPYEKVLSTLPLDTMLDLAGVSIVEPRDPSTSVLVLNVAAKRGPRCPDAHWVYVPESRGGFHRVGFYDRVDTHFLPRSMREAGEIASMYIEKSYPGGYEPTGEEIQQFASDATRQLGEWGFIGDVLLIDPTFIRTAYTWRMPHSEWPERAIAALEDRGITQAGRYARWKFQGIAASFEEGLDTGTRLAGGNAP